MLLLQDLDNNLYRFPKNKNELYAKAAAQTALNMGADIPFQDAFVIASNGYETHGSELTPFIEAYGLCESDMHKMYHDIAKDSFAQAISPDPEITKFLEHASQNPQVELAILTHGTKLWTERLLSTLRYTQYFDPDKVFYIEHELINHNKKDTSTHPFQTVCEELGYSPQDTIMFDDTQINLLYANKAGLTTVHTVWDNTPAEETPKFVDHVVRKVSDFNLT